MNLMLSGWCVAPVAVPIAPSTPRLLGAQEADVIVRNGRIWTGDSLRPSAQAVAIRGDRLSAVGTNAQADAHRTARTRVSDAGGRFMTPDFIDDHTHFSQAGGLACLVRATRAGARVRRRARDGSRRR